MAPRNGHGPDPFDGIPNLTGYTRPENVAARVPARAYPYTDEQLAWIFRTEPTREEKFEKYLKTIAIDFLTRAIATKNPETKIAVLRAYVLLNNGLVAAGIWPFR